MKEEINTREYNAINKFISFMLFLTKYAALILCVLYAAVAIFLGIMLVMKGNDITLNTLTETVDFISEEYTDNVVNYVQEYGKVKVTIAFMSYAAAISISAGLLRVIINKFKDIFNAIVTGNVFDDTTLEEINDCIPLSILLTFVQPIIMITIIGAIGIFDDSTINLSGVFLLAIVYIGKLVITSGNKLYNKNIKLSKELSDIKAYESEIKMSALKKHAEDKRLEELKKEVKRTSSKKSTTVKKEIVKKEPVKKTATTKKVTKKTTTK